MDEILVLEGGRIVERGTQAELLARNGLYRRMWICRAAFWWIYRGFVLKWK